MTTTTTTNSRNFDYDAIVEEKKDDDLMAQGKQFQGRCTKDNEDDGDGSRKNIVDEDMIDSTNVKDCQDSSPSPSVSECDVQEHHHPNHQHGIKEPPEPRSRTISFAGGLCGSAIRICLVDFPLALIFAIYVSAWCLEWVGDHYLLPQIELMKFQDAKRDFMDLTYYHRFCTEDDITATKTEELVLNRNATTKEAADHILYHGVSVYQDLLSKETSSALREFIVEQNKIQEGWYVIENKNRYSWGIEMNMHPAFQNVFQDLASNKQFIQAVQAIVGPDPAIIEFTAITSTYGATDQRDHQDVVPSGSGAKFARSFVPSYSLFMPLQDTTFDMGATHVCPGSHLCSENCEEYCFYHSLPVSGYNGSVWPRGSGALMNQQTTHKGMAHNDPTGPDRVVLIATFAPRPQTHRGVETRQIAQGGSYSLKWTHWGHTLYDYVHANRRMTELQVRLRSLGLLKGNGYSWINQASTRISNGDNGYCLDSLDQFIKAGGFPYWPKQWQALSEAEDDTSEEEDNSWEAFAKESVALSKQGLGKINALALCGYFTLVLIFSPIFGSRQNHKMRGVASFTKRLFLTHTSIVIIALLALRSLKQTNWAKQISSGKAYRLPAIPLALDEEHFATLPVEDDILITIHYASERFASYTDLLDARHPGNRRWKAIIRGSATGYETLPTALQLELSKTLMKWGNQTGRFLRQNSVRQWSEITDPQDLLGIAHEELVKASDPTAEVLLKQLDSLEADLIYDTWRDMALYEKTMSAYIASWRTRLLPTLKLEQQTKKQSSSPALLTVVKLTKRISHTPMPLRQRSRILERHSRQQPFAGAWAAERDIVEVQYQCKFNEWYQAYVVEAQSADMMLTIGYLDGEDALVPRTCIRDFVPYESGEDIQIRQSEDDYVWIWGSFVELIADAAGLDTYVVNGEDGTTYKILPHRIRRVDYKEEDDDDEDEDVTEDVSFNVGDSVYAQYDDGEDWFPAVVSAISDDGTFAVAYLDGDKEDDLDLDQLQPR